MTSLAATTCPEEPIESDHETASSTADQLVAQADEALRRGDLAVVRERLGAALKLSPSNPEISLALGHAEFSAGDLKAALVHYTSASAAQPNLSTTHSSRALVLQLLGNSAEAAMAAARAVSLDPANAVALKVLVRIHLNAGQGALAEKLCRRILQANASDADAAQMLRQALSLQPAAAKTPLTPLKPAPSPASTPSLASAQLARASIEKFLADGHEFFAGAVPPELTESNLRNSRILPTRFHILSLMPKGGICAEVGTQIGEFARHILSTLQPAKLHLFDIDFTPFDHAQFQDVIQQGQVELHHGDSSALLSAMPDGHFDFIYIDGDHSYEGVARDLEQAARKIKGDGWIVCNDYTMYSPLEKTTYGICRAVNEFCLRHGYEIRYLGLHPWGYHDVALKKQDGPACPVSAPIPAVVTANLNPPVRVPAVAPRNTSAPAVAREVVQNGSPAADKLIREIAPGDEMFTGDKAHYFGVGQSALHCMQAALFSAAKDRVAIKKILDLPCGHGRVMRHLKATFPHAQITACDLNRGAVDFCGKTFAAQPVYSHLDVKQIPLQGKFDLIWSGSLLTHLRPDACAAFVRLFHSLINPGGLIIFTLHGRWVERSLATGRYKYGLPDDRVAALLDEYYKTGFGYADYPSQSGYGIGLTSPAYALSNLVSLPDLKLITYHEKGWDNHQDVVCLQKQTAGELLG